MKDGDVVLQIKAILVRHTEWGYEDSEDGEFTVEGKKKAEELARKLPKFTTAISSLTTRAVWTARTLSRNKIRINTTPVLNEIPGGEEDEDFSPELAMQLAQRAFRFILAKMSEQRTEGKILFVSHAATVGGVKFLTEHKEGEKPKTIEDLYGFEPLTGIQFEMKVKSTLLPQ